MKQSLLIFCLFCGIISFAFSQKVNIVFIGNSITQGVQLSDPQRKSPPAQTASWLEKQNIGTIAIRNCGVSGKTTVRFFVRHRIPISRKVKAAADELDKIPTGTLVFSYHAGHKRQCSVGNRQIEITATAVLHQYESNCR